MTKLIAVAGGIGSGKSVVCSILSAMGYPVYDSDARAKAIMDSDARIKTQITSSIDSLSILPDGSIDRPRLSRIVFSAPAKLALLNSIVHGTVKADIIRWASELKSAAAFVETAILYQSGVDKLVDAVWIVDAPESVRVERVMKRSGLTAEQAIARIESQRFTPPQRHLYEHIIDNDGFTPLLRQINELLAKA